MKSILTVLLLCLITFGFSQNPVSISVLIYTVEDDGSLTPATTARTGQTVHYVLKARNQGTVTLPKKSVIVTGPFPKGTQYIPNSATQSADTFMEETDEGIRWEVDKPLAVNEVVEFSYRVYVTGADASPRHSTGIVRYEVELPNNCTGSLTMSNRASTEQHTVSDGWIYEYMAEPGDFLYLSVQNDCDHGEVSVSIYVNDELEDSARSDGAYSIATATSSF